MGANRLSFWFDELVVVPTPCLSSKLAGSVFDSRISSADSGANRQPSSASLIIEPRAVNGSEPSTEREATASRGARDLEFS